MRAMRRNRVFVGEMLTEYCCYLLCTVLWRVSLKLRSGDYRSVS